MVDTGNKTGFPPIRPVEKPADGDTVVGTPNVSSTVRAEQVPYLRILSCAHRLHRMLYPTNLALPKDSGVNGVEVRSGS